MKGEEKTKKKRPMERAKNRRKKKERERITSSSLSVALSHQVSPRCFSCVTLFFSLKFTVVARGRALILLQTGTVVGHFVGAETLGS